MKRIPSRYQQHVEERKQAIIEYDHEFAGKVAGIVRGDHALFTEKGWKIPKTLEKLMQIVEIRDAKIAKLRKLDASNVIGTDNMRSLRAFEEENE